jgi:hypothetical protein
MPALAQCDAFAYIYDQAGDPAPDILVVLKRVLDASGNPILLGPKTTTTDSAGSFHFTLPEFATAFISARASALWNCPDGRAFKVPLGPSGELVPDFSLPPSTLVEPPLVYVGDVLSIPKASETQDGYLSAADYVAFLAAAGADVGISQINTGAGLTGGPITETGTISLAPISGVAGTWANPTSISINAYGQIVAITATADTTAPNITAILATVVGTSVTITWTTDDFSDSQVEYSTDLSYSNSTTLNATSVTSHSVPLTSLIPSQGYHYRVKSRNTAGLLTTSGDNTFTTTGAVDTTPPAISAISAGTPTTTGATITWTTDDASDSQVDYGPTTSYGTSTTLDSTMATSHSVPITGLTVGTPYHYRVKSRNAASLLTTSADNSFTTDAPPVISAVTSSGITGTAAMINWTTNEAADSQVDYSADPDTSYGTSTPITNPVPPGTLSHAVPLSTLTAATLYHYRVKSKDAAGNAATPVTGTFNTTAPSGDLLTGLTSMWKLDEPTGTAARVDSKGTNNLTVALGTLSVASVAGKIGNAAHFVGDATILSIADNSTVRTGPIDYTVAVWVRLDSKPASPTGAAAICKAGGGASDEYIVDYESAADRFEFTIQGTGSYAHVLSTPAGSPVIGTWYLIIAWHDQASNSMSIQVGDDTTLYPVNTFTPSPPIIVGGDNLTLGYYGPATASAFHGTIDEAAFWQGRKLTNAADRAALWAGGAGLPFSSWT